MKTLSTPEEIVDAMEAAMPYVLYENIKTYVVEAVKVGQDEALTAAAEIAFPECDRYEPYWKEFGEKRKQKIERLKK